MTTKKKRKFVEPPVSRIWDGEWVIKITEARYKKLLKLARKGYGK